MSGDRELIGRQRETALLRGVLAAGSRGARGAAALLRGEPGIGKTALLEWTRAQAERDGFAVLRAVGSEAESGLAFGALHQVLAPLLEHSRTLPSHQREALECALGLRDGLPPGGFLVGAAALALLAGAARPDRPLLVLVDDLHWVDASSAAVFAFLHRRIADLPLAFVSACRPDGAAAEGWPVHPFDVPALDPADAGALLRRRHPGLAAGAARRVLQEAAGNPLALAELPSQLDEDQVRGIVPLPERLPLGARLERLFADRLGTLSVAASRVLLLAALGGRASAAGAATWLGAAAGPEDAEAVLDRIEASGLARPDAAGRLLFRHPLVCSAVISSASAAERRRAHLTLAQRLEADDPRRLVHEAAAAEGPDEELAARLQEAGRWLAGRGGDAEGALLLDRAAALSPDPDARARRLTWAAVMAARGGRLAYTARLVEEIGRRPVPQDIAPLFAYAVVYVDQSHRIDFESSFTLLPRALDALAEGTTECLAGLAEQVYFKLLLACAYTDDPRGRRALDERRAGMSALARLCLRAWSDPARTAHGVIGELHELAAHMSPEQEVGAGWLLLWTASAVDVADAGLWRRFTGQHAYATQGSIAKATCRQDFLHGRWDAARACLREARAAEELGYHTNALLFRHYYAHVLAGRGDEEGLHRIERLIGPPAARAGMRFVTDHLARLHGLVALAHGRFEEAYGRFAALTPPGVLPRGLSWFHLPFFDFVEAAVHTGRDTEARAHVAAGRAARMQDISPHHAFLLTAAAALAAPDEEADAAYAAACAVPGAGSWVFELARLRLAHGSRLRRRRRPAAHDVLRDAHQAFRGLRAEPWVQRCARELRAAGHPVDAPASGPGSLTGQELRIARLAAQGLTNKEIGRRLHISPRTVAAHLYKIFPRLGITSRAALTRALKSG
ncbi:LuxR family transcriptional regulator [Streptomyces sp. NPDC007369]|uniref:LuxR family transcriptional regulator n=1 Tax=Streptomyces sp. NPDC007369 TaxID=3154589 RepID=UPI0033E935D3